MHLSECSSCSRCLVTVFSPQPPKPPEPESSWADEPSDVVHLTDADFYDFLDENPSALVMFYAPCKQLPSVRDCGYVHVFRVKCNTKLAIVCTDILLHLKSGARDPQVTTAIAVNIVQREVSACVADKYCINRVRSLQENEARVHSGSCCIERT